MKISLKKWLGTLACTVILGNTVHALQSAENYKAATRYNLIGQVTGTIMPDPDGSGPLGYAAVRNIYDSAGRLKRIEMGELNSFPPESVNPSSWGSFGFQVFTTSYQYYDEYGRLHVKYSVGANGSDEVLTQYKYDDYSRIDCLALRMNPSEYSGYRGSPASAPRDACTLGIEGSDGKDRITKYEYDDYDNVVEEIRAYGTDLEQVYRKSLYKEEGSQLEKVADANLNTTTYEYDFYGRIKKIFLPVKGASPILGDGFKLHSTSDFEQYDYDLNGNRTYLKMRDETKEIFYHYDNLNRMVKKDYNTSNMRDIYYGYDLRGLNTYARYDSHTGVGISNEFSAFGDLDTTTNNLYGISRTISHTYDKNGNRETIRHPDAKGFNYGFDGLNRMSQLFEVASSGSSPVSILNITYHNKGGRDRISRPSSYWTNFSFDGLNRLTGMGHNLFSGGDDLTSTFAYNPANQIKQLTLSNDRYAYQGNENWTGDYSSNGLNQYTSVGDKSFVYNKNGNLVSDESGITYSYDHENRLIGTSGTVNSTFKYDPLGRLYEVIIGAIKRQFLYDGDALIAEYDGMTGATNLSNNPVRRYAHGDQVDEPLAEYRTSSINSSSRRYLHADHQGSIIAHSNSWGSPQAKLKYDNFGIPAAGNDGRFGYTGQIWFPELGLYHYKARMYSPHGGRFLQTDPIGYEDQMNLYAYVGNDPMNYVDSTGNMREKRGNLLGLFKPFLKKNESFKKLIARQEAMDRLDKAILQGNQKAAMQAVRDIKQTGFNKPKAPIHGKAQKTTKNKQETTHASTSERIAQSESSRPDATSVHLNQSISTITKGKVNSSKRPDVATVRKDEKVDVTEVLSGKQTEQQMVKKYSQALGKHCGKIKCTEQDK